MGGQLDFSSKKRRLGQGVEQGANAAPHSEEPHFFAAFHPQASRLRHPNPLLFLPTFRFSPSHVRRGLFSWSSLNVCVIYSRRLQLEAFALCRPRDTPSFPSPVAHAHQVRSTEASRTAATFCSFPIGSRRTRSDFVRRRRVVWLVPAAASAEGGRGRGAVSLAAGGEGYYGIFVEPRLRLVNDHVRRLGLPATFGLWLSRHL